MPKEKVIKLEITMEKGQVVQVKKNGRKVKRDNLFYDPGDPGFWPVVQTATYDLSLIQSHF